MSLSEKVEENKLIIGECICDALNVDDVKEFIRINEDIILREDLSNGEKVMLIRKNAGEKLV